MFSVLSVSVLVPSTIVPVYLQKVRQPLSTPSPSTNVMTSITPVAACLFLLVGTTPTASFLLSSPTNLSSGASSRTKLSAAEAGVDVKDLLYQEQENLIIQRGELEEGFFSNAKPLEASVVNVRGAGEFSLLLFFCIVCGVVHISNDDEFTHIDNITLYVIICIYYYRQGRRIWQIFFVQ